MRICDLQEKEVINVCDCRRLGFVADLEFDICSGRILALIVPGPAQFCGFFGRDWDYVIPFCQVKQIGEDIILVDIRVDECQVRR